MNITPKTILLADDDTSILTILTRALKAQHYEVMASEHLSDVDGWVAQGLGDVVITDVTMPSGNGLDGLKRWRAARPDLPVIVMSAHNTLLNAAASQELGAVQFLPKPFGLAALTEAVAMAVGGQATAAPREQEGVVRISNDLAIVGKSPAMQAVFQGLANLIGNDLTVLIQGASGTGKELIARALHALSKRKAKPFIALNMAAIPRELIESALFGHEKGAFTGAHQKQDGAFVQAQGGTLFLDEIGDMPMAAQTRLLRVLQEQEVTPVGASGSIKTDVRVVAATHRDLKRLVANGEFREDLYFRLHVVPLTLPTLAERREDIPLLVERFAHDAAKRGLNRKQFSADALEVLCSHAWQGNVRELQHVVYRAAATIAASTIEGGDIATLLATPPLTKPTLVANNPQPASNEAIPQSIEAFLETQFRQYFAAHQGELPAAGLYDRILARMEKPLIMQTLRATRGNQLKAAEILGINRNTLRKKIRDLAIHPDRIRSDAA